MNMLCEGSFTMNQILCKRSNAASDVRCSVCGQGFLVYWAELSRSDRKTVRQQIQEQLREHHAQQFAEGGAHDVHPKDGFHLPEWVGSPEYSAASPVSGEEAPGV